MELRLLRYFLAVAKEKSFTGAAQTLYVTQPTLSRQIQELEEELGKKLFVRGKKSITLTEDGFYFQQRAQEILELVEKTQKELNNTDEILSGEIHIGGGETDGMRYIAKVAHSLSTNYPLIRYTIFSGNAESLFEKLEKGLIDFGLFIEPTDLTNYNFIRLPVKDTWGLLLRKDNPLAQKKYIEPHDIVNIPLICSRQKKVNDELQSWLGYSFDKINVVMQYNLLYNASLMVEEGIASALCIDKIINTSAQSPLCFRKLHPELEVGLVFAWKKGRPLSKAAKKFLEYMTNKVELFTT